MRIALDATYSVDPHPSGIAVYSREILNGLAVSHPRDRYLHLFRAKQFARAPKSPIANVRRALLLPALPRLFFNPDIFHALNQRVDRRLAKKVISTFHDLFVITGEYSTPEFRARFADQARRAADNSDLIVAVSQFTATQVSTLLGVESARIRVIPHGVHLPLEQPPSTQREKLILFVGALQVRKNIIRLVEAFEMLPPDWRLVLAGSATGYGAPDILKRIAESACRDRIEITGYVPQTELALLYRRASIFAFPSLDEGFGIPVLEAMAHGLPVVTSNRSGLSEAAGDAAMLVDPKDSHEIAAALCRLMDDATLRCSLQELGLQRAEQFSWARAVEATYSVYREVLG